MNDVIRRTAAMPGERTIVLVSPGFLNPDEAKQQSDVTERALKANIVINTMDVRGLYTELPDVSDDRPPQATIAGYVQQYTSQEMAADQDTLATRRMTPAARSFTTITIWEKDFAAWLRRPSTPTCWASRRRT